MSKITQEAYDEEIKELMEGLGLTEEEAVEDAIKCFEMKVMPASFVYIAQRLVQVILAILANHYVTHLCHVVESSHFRCARSKEKNEIFQVLTMLITYLEIYLICS